MTATFYLKQSHLAQIHNIYELLQLFLLSPKSEKGYHYRWGVKIGLQICWNRIYFPMQHTYYMATRCILTKTGFNHPCATQLLLWLRPRCNLHTNAVFYSLAPKQDDLKKEHLGLFLILPQWCTPCTWQGNSIAVPTVPLFANARRGPPNLSQGPVHSCLQSCPHGHRRQSHPLSVSALTIRTFNCHCNAL